MGKTNNGEHIFTTERPQNKFLCIKSLFYTETGRFRYRNDRIPILHDLILSEKW